MGVWIWKGLDGRRFEKDRNTVDTEKDKIYTDFGIILIVFGIDIVWYMGNV